jgi:hypothetical protein
MSMSVSGAWWVRETIAGNEGSRARKGNEKKRAQTLPLSLINNRTAGKLMADVDSVVEAVSHLLCIIGNMYCHVAR